MNNDQEVFEKRREIKPLLYRDYSVKQIGLFGSFSNGTFSDDSDVDILVELEKPIGWKFFSLDLYLEKLFNRKIDLVTKNALKEQIKDQILREVQYV